MGKNNFSAPNILLNLKFYSLTKGIYLTTDIITITYELNEFLTADRFCKNYLPTK